MTFSLEDRDLMRKAVRGVLSKAEPISIIDMLRDTGFVGLLEEDISTALVALFEEHGANLVSSPALDLVALHGLGLPIDNSRAFIYPSLTGHDLVAGKWVSGRMEVDGLLLRGHERAEELIAVVESPFGLQIAYFAAESVHPKPVNGFDLDLGISRVTEIVDATIEPLESDSQLRSLSLCRLALAHELVGVCKSILDLTINHVVERVQFGRPIGANQAAKHRLADTFVAMKACEALLNAEPDSADVFLSSAAKAHAGRTALRACNSSLQLCGAIGLTREHPLHRFVRRAHLLDSFLGSSVQLQREIGSRLVDTAELPSLINM